MNQIAMQNGVTTIKRLHKAKTQIFNNDSKGELRTMKTIQINIFDNMISW